MRILFLTTDAFGGHGGLAKYNRDLLTALCSHPAVSEIVTMQRGAGGEMEPLPAKLTFLTEGLGGRRRFLSAIARQMARRPGFALVVCGHINLLPPTLLAAWRFRAPLILCVYGVDVWTSPGRLAGWTCSHIDGFISISKITAERFRSWAPLEGKRQWLIPNAIELDRFSPGPKDPDLLERYGLQGKTIIATLARLSALERMKGVDEMLEVLPRIVTAHPRLVYLIMGDGSDLARLQQKARALGLGEHAVFTGRVSEHEKVRHYRLADVYVMPSRGEGFGFVFLEALACGVPVVASSVDGGREAIRNGLLGELVDPRVPDDIVRGVEQAFTRPRGVVPQGLDYFSFGSFTTRVHRFLDEVIHG